MALILIIDDEAPIRAILSFQIKKNGHTVLEAQNGEEGLRLAVTQRPALIFLDVLMPKIDGWQLCKRLKEEPRTQSVPVVMLTNSVNQIDELHGWEAGVDEYLTKPWDPRKLHDVINRFCPSAPEGGATR